MKGLSRSVRAINAASMGDRKADRILTGCSLVNVYTREIQRNIQIAISGRRIAYVGTDASHTAGASTLITDVKGRYVTPGLADPHIHIDSFLLPQELAKRCLLHGTTSLFSDPIDAVCVGGFAGFREFVRMTSGLPARIFNMIPGGLPVDGKFGNTRALTPEEEGAALKLDGVLGMGEIFSWTKVTLRDPATIRSIERMLEAGCVINGHTAGASGRKLQAYISSGIISCHEPIDFGQALERLRLGMWIMIREGSIRRDLAGILSEVIARGIRTDRLMFCADELNPSDLQRHGHIDHCIREAVRLGADPVDAVTMATRNCFDYYGMGRDLGGIAPGRLADMIVLDDLESFRPRLVLVGGRPAVSDGSLVAAVPRRRIAGWLRETVRIPGFTADDFVMRAGARSVRANTIRLVTEIVTRHGTRDLAVRDGNVQASREMDVWKVAAFDRVHGTGEKAVGFLENFGAEIGAMASTRCFHENDMIVIGQDERDMALAANRLIRTQGGMVVVRDGRVAASLPLQVGGLASTRPFENVASDFEEVNAAVADAGCRFSMPFLITTFLSFLALPSIRILHSGMVDVRRREFVPPIVAGGEVAAG